MITPTTTNLMMPGDLVQYVERQQVSREEYAGSHVIPPEILADLPHGGHNWLMCLTRPEEIDPTTAILTFDGFNNVDYNRWPGSSHPDFSDRAISREQLKIGSVGIITQRVFIEYAGMYKDDNPSEDEFHAVWAVLFDKRIFLVSEKDLVLKKRRGT